MAGVTNSERVLANFARASHIPKEAEQWLINCVDPCHDRLTKLEGYPDDNQSASVVQRVKQAFTIQAPQPSTTNLWDLMIINTPVLTTNNLTNVIFQPVGTGVISSNVASITTNNTNLTKYGGLSFIAVPSGTPFSWANISSRIAATTGYIVANSLPSIYSQGPSRIIANAFEVCNTTADLTAQGSVLTFRQPVQDFEDAGTFSVINTTGAGITSYASVSALPIPAPPVNLAQAMLLPGSRQWKAKEGAYVVSALNSDRLPPQDSNITQPMFYQNPSDNSSTAQVEIPTTVATGYSFYGGGTLNTASPQLWSNFDQSGCIFSGLSATTTLQVSWIVDIERFPTEQQGDLVVIATPSCVYSPACIEAYSMITQGLPTGVPFGQNGLGDWFMGAVSKVRDAVMPAIQIAAKKNPMLKSLVAVHDLVTEKKGKGKGGGKKAGKGFLAPSSIANNDKAVTPGAMRNAPKGKKWVVKK
jgi:hypothetical protein